MATSRLPRRSTYQECRRRYTTFFTELRHALSAALCDKALARVLCHMLHCRMCLHASSVWQLCNKAKLWQDQAVQCNNHLPQWVGGAMQPAAIHCNSQIATEINFHICTYKCTAVKWGLRREHACPNAMIRACNPAHGRTLQS
jgi:hypothetical protein